MTPERWRQVEDLCHAALARPPQDRASFLTQACAGDQMLQREVESLLAQESDAGQFMNVPAVAAVGSAVLGRAQGALTGQRLGSYTIHSLLGAGGMGEVYRAHDEALGREVAIKVLPPASNADPERRTRFEREARLLATLNHPNIGAIYSVEEADGVRGLVLELVEGETLAERIARTPGSRAQNGGLPLEEALTIARQITEALEVAHEKGIVHRDLKPANIKITPDGTVKVLDFGLAKAVSPDPSHPDLSAFRAGVILGTAAYMSPEQARGQGTDKRTDVWAFSCVLYEMLTGRVAFPGDTISDTIAKILERQPDWAALPASTPEPIRRLLTRCLNKDPKRRLRDIGDVRIEIDAVAEGPPPASQPAVAVSTPVRTRSWLPWVAVVALAAALGVREASRPASAPDNPLANARFTRVTDWEGTEWMAQISPDGRFVAFLADPDRQFDVWLNQVGTGEFRNLTANIPPMANNGGLDSRSLGFSGDGAEIWFSAAGEPGDPKMLVPLTGGKPRPFLSGVAPSWSPDGSRLVYVNNMDGGEPLFVADRTGADPHQILAPEEGVHHHNPVWSPDGQWIYFVRGSLPQVDMDVWRLRPSGGAPERLTEQHSALMLAPLDARTLLYVARAEDRSGPWLWSLDLASKVARRVSWGLEQYTSVAASRDGRRVVATLANRTSSLWTVPILDRLAEDREVQQYRVTTAQAMGPRFGGTLLFYLSDGGTGVGLWRFRNGEGLEIRKGTDGALSEPPAVSPDGRRVAVVVRQAGELRLVTMSADGTNARTLATSIDIEPGGGLSSADWSPDGAWIVTGGRDAEGSALFKIPADGGAPVRLVPGQALGPVWSPDGDLIVYSGPIVAGQVTLRGVRPDGTPVELPREPVRRGGYRFLPDGKGLVYLPREASVDFWLLDLATGNRRQLTGLSDQGRLLTFDITPDGKHIVFDRWRENSDIVLIDLPK